MFSIDKIKKIKEFCKEDAREVKNFLTSRWLFFGCSVVGILLLTVLKTLHEDGQEIFSLQKGAFILEVFAPTDLNPEFYPIVEESLRALPGVKGVVATSPEESLKRMVAEKTIAEESEWLLKKSFELKGKNTILPWSYDLHLSRWDEPFLKELINRIEKLEVGYPKTKAISEIHYDLERWSLTFALYNYLRWVRTVLVFFACSLAGFLFVSFKRWVQSGKIKEILLKEVRLIFLFGFCAGLVSHIFCLFVLSLAFFSSALSWQSQVGRFLLFQISLGILFAFLGESKKKGV